MQIENRGHVNDAFSQSKIFNATPDDWAKCVVVLCKDEEKNEKHQYHDIVRILTLDHLLLKNLTKEIERKNTFLQLCILGITLVCAIVSIISLCLSIIKK